jgi:hypothetical protein
MLCRLIAFLMLAAAGFTQTPQTPLKPEVIQLSRIRIRAVENLSRLPNYTCRETIERSIRKPPANRFQLVDTVRLEVALVKGKELFGWPGAEKFEEGDIGDMVKGGAIGNGNFASHARSIFMGAGARFSQVDESTLDGRAAIRWNFHVAQNQSHYMLRIGANEGMAGYHGSFWIDPKTLDLIRLEVIADEIPPNLPLKIASDRMDYAVVNIGGEDFLLPKGSQMTMTDILGNEHRNRTVFTNCRQYGTESTISFADASPDVLPTLPPAKALEPIVLPSGVLIMMSLDQEITIEKNAVGDEITATVSGAVKRGKTTIVPKGAKFKGRLTQLTRSGNDCVFSLEFHRVEFSGRQGFFNASLVDVGIPVDRSPPGIRMSRYLNTEFRVLLGKDSKQSDPVMVYVRGSRLVLAKGLRIVLRTGPAE